ncbi:MAG: SRPBCC family protein [Pyrinomonadaceae bacterium]
MANKTIVTAEPGRQELFITREFEAPRELVFKAHIDPELYIQWVGPRELTMQIDKWEPYEGGSYKFTHSRGDHEYAFFGVNHEVLANERIIGTFEFDGLPERGHVILGTTRFEELPDGRSRVVHQSVFQAVADRDGMIKAGMERGATEGYEKLDALLAEQEQSSGSAAG